jgi:carboxyl-terminal processing protease
LSSDSDSQNEQSHSRKDCGKTYFYEVIALKKFLLPLSYVLVIIATVLGTLVVTQTPVGQPSSGYKLQQLEQLLVEKFVDGADSQKLQDAAAHAMVGALGDRWSYYIPKTEYDAYVESKNNEYVGVGVTIQQIPEGYHVVKVNTDGPADKAGILPGDIIIAVDGQAVTQISFDEGKELVRGPEGTDVTITVQRNGVEHTFTMTRATVKTPVATGKMLEDNIGLVTIANFNANCHQETMAAVEELLEQGATALIFDVRFNGGGYKKELVKILDDLLPEGPLFHSEYYTGESTVDESDSKCLEIPMAVLINDQSISAAEFFAAALREYDWAILVGQQTVGKGHYQETYLLSDGSAVGVSTGRYTTPKGVDLEGVGLTPDIAVEVDEETYYAIYAQILDPMEDPQILAAINALKTTKTP